MNKAITDGVLLTPPAFENGLDVWSSGNGTPGSDTYQNAPNAVFVPADQDFGGCLELQKIDATQQVRYMGETPLLPGCYLQIRARVKAISGNLPNVRIAGWAGGAGGAHVNGVIEVGPATTLQSYGDVVEVTAIVGSGARGGVDMIWGNTALYGHFGLDLTGPNGGVVRIDDFEIEDVTGAFLRDMLNVVDVRDFGAIGDGIADDSAAFEAADAIAGGRRILVPAGTYFLGNTVSLDSHVTFEGTVSMPTDKMLLLTKSFDLPTYIAAFGNEELAFRKAFQALLNNTDHDSLDMGGRKVAVTGPIDMQAAVPNKTSFATRRVIRNGQLEATNSPAWDTEVFTSSATYDPAQSRTLSNVVNVANIPVGALVEGNGVGREIYVRTKDIAAGTLTLNAPLYDAAGTQTFTFTDFKYMMDFSGFGQLSKFAISDVEFQCNGRSSGIRLARSGVIFQLRDCFVTRPKDRGVSSIGTGCQGILIDRCQFLSNEDAQPVSERTSIALNTNANDANLRDNRSTRFLHFAVLGGANTIVTGNHFFQGDSTPNGVRSAGLVLADNYCCTTVTGNYVDNCFIEWTNERDSSPDFVSGFSFASLSISGNIFLTQDTAPWFSFLVVKPHGSGHFLNGLSVTGNMFRGIGNSIDRVDRIDTSFAGLDYSRTKNVTFENNTFHLVSRQTRSPIKLRHNEASAAQSWNIGFADELPFGATVRNIDTVIPLGEILDAQSNRHHGTPYAVTEQGPNQNEVTLVWEKPVKGEVSLVARIDA